MASKTTAAKASAAKAEEVVTDNSVVTSQVIEEQPTPAEEKKTFKPKQFDPNQYVTVRNGFQGTLVYKSPKTGERFIWDKFGDEQDMEVAELRNARSASKAFFINNWFMFDDPEVIDYLGMKQYYKFALTIDQFDELFTKTPAEIKSIVSKLSRGQKNSVAYRAKELIAAGEIDSNKAISALEESLGRTLVER
jgi:hypothetical protein